MPYQDPQFSIFSDCFTDSLHRDIHVTDNDGRSSLHYASQSRAIMADKLVSALISGGMDVGECFIIGEGEITAVRYLNTNTEAKY